MQIEEPKRTITSKKILGWREWVSLPALGIRRIKVKVDSGAHTSALHAEEIEYYIRNGKQFVKFLVFPRQDSDTKVLVHAAVIGRKVVKSSIGVFTRRPTICTKIQIGEERFPVKITLINRDVMGFRMLLGREAIRRRFLIDSGRSFLAGRVKKKKKRVGK